MHQSYYDQMNSFFTPELKWRTYNFQKRNAVDIENTLILAYSWQSHIHAATWKNVTRN